MLGKIITTAEGVPVARIVICTEVMLDMGPASDLTQVLALLERFLAVSPLRSGVVCDNRDYFQPRPMSSLPYEPLRQALRAVCGAEDPKNVDWAMMTYLDSADDAAPPGRIVSCSLGRKKNDGNHGVSLWIGAAEGSAWGELVELSTAIAERWPGLWRWITAGKRFCPLDFQGFHLAHLAIHRVARRFPEVDIGDTLGMNTSHWSTQLRTVGAVTYIDSRLLPNAAALSASVGFDPGRPMLSEQEMRDYIHADRQLRRAQPQAKTLLLPPWNEESSRAWLERWQTMAKDLGEPSVIDKVPAESI